MRTHRERYNRTAFNNAQLAYNRVADPFWDQPGPEPDDEEQEDDGGLGEWVRRRRDRGSDHRNASVGDPAP